MKVERNVIAKIFECDEADVKCDNCARSETDLLFNCTFWDRRTDDDDNDFCPFFSLRRSVQKNNRQTHE